MILRLLGLIEKWQLDVWKGVVNELKKLEGRLGSAETVSCHDTSPEADRLLVEIGCTNGWHGQRSTMLFIY